MDDDKEAAEMALLIIDVVLRQRYVANPVQPQQDDDDEILFASQITRTKIGMAEKHKGYKDSYSNQLNKQLMWMETTGNFKIIFFN